MVWASSMNRMIGVGDDLTSSISPFSRFSNSPLMPAPACSSARSSVRTVTFRRRRRHVALRDAQRESFDHGGLADARFAGQNRIVLPAPRQDVDHLANLEIAPQHRYRSCPAARSRSDSRCTDPGSASCRRPLRRRRARRRRTRRSSAAAVMLARIRHDRRQSSCAALRARSCGIPC